MLELLPARIARNISMNDGCWLWSGQLDRDGYGRVYVAQQGRPPKTIMAHRYVYLSLSEPIPDGLQLDHLCRVRACVNPAHLEPVTRAENMRRRSASQTHCKLGHEFNSANTYMRPSGHRQCRRCNRSAVARYAGRKRKPRSS